MQKKSLNKKQIIIVSLVSLLLVSFAVGIDMMIKAQPGGMPALFATASDAEATPSKANSYQYAQISSKLTEIVEDKPYEPSPEILNLAYFYPEGADTSDVINSYAGRIYTELTAQEAQYMADIYDLSDRTPLSMAKQLSLPTSRIMGKYNPNDASHDPDNPATWIVGSFKNANVAFYDGDGNRINAYSAVKEIMSMASVYSYYHDMYDAEAMRDYAENLWKHSHSYKISMGNVYYCSGCLNRTVQEEAEEAIEQEKQQQLLEESLAKRTAGTSGTPMVYTLPATDGPANDTAEDELNDEATLFFQFGDEEASEEESTSADTIAEGLTAPENASEDEAGASSNTLNAEPTLADAASESSTYITVTAEEAAPETETAVQTSPAETAPSVTETAAALQTDAPEASENVPAEEATLAGFSVSGGTAGLSYQGEILLADNNEATLFGGADTGSSGPDGETAAAASVPEAQASEAVSSAINASSESSSAEYGPGITVLEDSEASENSGEEATLATTDGGKQSGTRTVTKTTCPGHIDLYITVTIYGIDDNNGLMKFDTVGNHEANFNEEWQGWTDETKAYARALNAEDWFKRYGLTISAINVRNPLTESEIDAYLSRLPEDISQARRDIVDFALHSVGKVPYYWGGKPQAPRYERNNFGTLVAPDTKGRVLRGLDCSGWINWVYWSVLGNRLAGESTGTLIGCGERISRSELKPGDIIIRTGADAHVVMFLEWAGNGNMIAVHETGGVTNNVTVSEMTANWPYYRKLIE